MTDKEIKKTVSKEVSTVKPKLTASEREALKAKFRRVSIEGMGRLHIDDKYKKPGKVLRIDNDTPATRQYMENLGYTPVERIDDAEVGSGSLSEPGQIDSLVHIEQSVYGPSQPGLLYECDEEIYNLRKEVESEENKKMLSAKIEDNAAESFKREHGLK